MENGIKLAPHLSKPIELSHTHTHATSHVNVFRFSGFKQLVRKKRIDKLLNLVLNSVLLSIF